MKEIEDQTKDGSRYCVKFQNRYNEINYLKIQNDVGCFSYIGKLKNKGSQTLSLDSISCLDEATIAHELVHALGFDHEHNRPDRDDWITIDFNNIQNGELNLDFRKLNESSFQDLDTPYDYESIMHYHSTAHVINNQSKGIEAIKLPFEIKPISKLSKIDVLEIKKFYNCKAGIQTFYLIP